ncbi:hypothetical protein PG995_015203 [Apiospora arundinis]
MSPLATPDFDFMGIHAFLNAVPAPHYEARFNDWRDHSSLDLSAIHMELAPSAPASTCGSSTGSASRRSTSTTSTAQRSVFSQGSQGSRRSHRTAASSPPRSAAPTVTSAFGAHATIHALYSSECVLPCEYAPLGLCNETFQPGEFEVWEDHIVSQHLRYQIPDRCICWFCDQEFSSEENNADARYNFSLRLEHIREHIYDGRSVRHMRPDYFLLEHMYRNSQIREAHYQRECERSEGPSTAGIVKHNFKPPERRREEELRSRVIHDNRKEEQLRRRERRQRQQRSAHRTTTMHSVAA